MSLTRRSQPRVRRRSRARCRWRRGRRRSRADRRRPPSVRSRHRRHPADVADQVCAVGVPSETQSPRPSAGVLARTPGFHRDEVVRIRRRGRTDVLDQRGAVLGAVGLPQSHTVVVVEGGEVDEVTHRCDVVREAAPHAHDVFDQHGGPAVVAQPLVAARPVRAMASATPIEAAGRARGCGSDWGDGHPRTVRAASEKGNGTLSSFD